nr:hypothetical protein GCM10020092_090260 [Actinoplanes digitatis]
MVGGVRVGAGEVVGQHPGLLPQRGDQPVRLAAVLGTLADRVDVRLVRAAQLVIDDDAALHVQAAAFGQRRARADA